MIFRKAQSDHLSYFYDIENIMFGSIGFFWFKSIGILYQNGESYHDIKIHLAIIYISITIIKPFNKKIK